MKATFHFGLGCLATPFLSQLAAASTVSRRTRASARCLGTRSTTFPILIELDASAHSGRMFLRVQNSCICTAVLRKPRDHLREEGRGESAGRGTPLFGQTVWCEAIASERKQGNIPR